MNLMTPFAADSYALSSCALYRLRQPHEAARLAELLAAMDPWRTLGYTATALERYLLRVDTTLYRYVISSQGASVGVICVRYPWLRGACLELLGLATAAQGGGIGTTLLQWLEAQVRLASANVWVLVSAFNQRARTFYARQGFVEIGVLQDFIRPGCAEILLRKVL